MEKHKNISVPEETHKKAKLLSALSGLPIWKVLDLILEGTTEKDIIRLAKKENYQKQNRMERSSCPVPSPNIPGHETHPKV